MVNQSQLPPTAAKIKMIHSEDTPPSHMTSLHLAYCQNQSDTIAYKNLEPLKSMPKKNHEQITRYDDRSL